MAMECAEEDEAAMYAMGISEKTDDQHNFAGLMSSMRGVLVDRPTLLASNVPVCTKTPPVSNKAPLPVVVVLLGYCYPLQSSA
eukprot:scaffold9027_cov61-Attheya_sp.AAC.8